jgi:peptidoglycan biosynthesis protein MviN/MurJ (putative lipid II flippase)
MGHKGIALASSISATVNMSLLMAVFSMRHGLPWAREILPHILRVAGAAALMGGLAVMLLGWLEGETLRMPLGRFVALFGTLALSGGVYFILCHLTGVREVHDLIAALWRRPGPGGPSR